MGGICTKPDSIAVAYVQHGQDLSSDDIVPHGALQEEAQGSASAVHVVSHAAGVPAQGLTAQTETTSHQPASVASDSTPAQAQATDTSQQQTPQPPFSPRSRPAPIDSSSSPPPSDPRTPSPRSPQRIAAEPSQATTTSDTAPATGPTPEPSTPDLPQPLSSPRRHHLPPLLSVPLPDLPSRASSSDVVSTASCLTSQASIASSTATPSAISVHSQDPSQSPIPPTTHNGSFKRTSQRPAAPEPSAHDQAPVVPVAAPRPQAVSKAAAGVKSQARARPQSASSQPPRLSPLGANSQTSTTGAARRTAPADPVAATSPTPRTVVKRNKKTPTDRLKTSSSSQVALLSQAASYHQPVGGEVLGFPAPCYPAPKPGKQQPHPDQMGLSLAGAANMEAARALGLVCEDEASYLSAGGPCESMDFSELNESLPASNFGTRQPSRQASWLHDTAAAQKAHAAHVLEMQAAAAAMQRYARQQQQQQQQKRQQQQQPTERPSQHPQHEPPLETESWTGQMPEHQAVPQQESSVQSLSEPAAVVEAEPQPHSGPQPEQAEQVQPVPADTASDPPSHTTALIHQDTETEGQDGGRTECSETPEPLSSPPAAEPSEAAAALQTPPQQCPSDPQPTHRVPTPPLQQPHGRPPRAPSTSGSVSAPPNLDPKQGRHMQTEPPAPTQTLSAQHTAAPDSPAGGSAATDELAEPPTPEHDAKLAHPGDQASSTPRLTANQPTGTAPASDHSAPQTAAVQPMQVADIADISQPADPSPDGPFADPSAMQRVQAGVPAFADTATGMGGLTSLAAWQPCDYIIPEEEDGQLSSAPSASPILGQPRVNAAGPKPSPPVPQSGMVPAPMAIAKVGSVHLGHMGSSMLKSNGHLGQGSRSSSMRMPGAVSGHLAASHGRQRACLMVTDASGRRRNSMPMLASMHGAPAAGGTSLHAKSSGRSHYDGYSSDVYTSCNNTMYSSADTEDTEARFLSLQSRLAKTPTETRRNRFDPYRTGSSDDSDERHCVPTAEALARFSSLLPPSRLTQASVLPNVSWGPELTDDDAAEEQSPVLGADVRPHTTPGALTAEPPAEDEISTSMERLSMRFSRVEEAIRSSRQNSLRGNVPDLAGTGSLTDDAALTAMMRSMSKSIKREQATASGAEVTSNIATPLPVEGGLVRSSMPALSRAASRGHDRTRPSSAHANPNPEHGDAAIMPTMAACSSVPMPTSPSDHDKQVDLKPGAGDGERTTPSLAVPAWSTVGISRDKTAGLQHHTSADQLVTEASINAQQPGHPGQEGLAPLAAVAAC